MKGKALVSGFSVKRPLLCLEQVKLYLKVHYYYYYYYYY
jgi:hypothetical protein